MATIRHCELCRRNVEPAKKFNWLVFIFLCGIFYLPYYWLKSKSCPICGTTHLAAPQIQHAAERQFTAASETAAAAEPRSNMDQAHSEPIQNETLLQIKDISSQYIHFFAAMLKNPYQYVRQIGQEHFIFGLISIALVPFLFALMYFIGAIRFDFGGLSANSFGSLFIKPVFNACLTMTLINSLIYIAARYGELPETYKSITARFGTALIPVVACLPLGCLLVLFGIIKIYYIIPTVLALILGALNVTLVSFNKTEFGKIDLLYLILALNLISVWIFYGLFNYI